LLPVHLALVTQATGRPAKMVATRAESIRSTTKRHAVKMWYRLGTDANGRLRALQARLVADTGAYASLGGSVLNWMTEAATGPYNIPAVKIDAYSVYTNNAVAGAFGGYGGIQACVGLESQMDELAAALAMDPLELRRTNALRPGDSGGLGQPLAAPHGALATLDSAAGGTLLGRRRLSDPASHEAANADRAQSIEPWLRHGVGVACSVAGVGLGEGFRDHTELVVELYPDGRVTVLTSTSELGQGAYTVCAQMAAERFAVPLERVQVAGGDSAIGLDAGTTTAQRTTLMLGNAILDAGRNAEQTLSGLAAEKLGWPAGPAALFGGSLQGTGGTVALDRLLASTPLRVTGAYTLSTPSDNPEGLPAFKLKRPHRNHGYATHVAEVQVNTLTGEVRVIAMESHIDGGRPISVQGFEGQSEGAISRGIGYALFERLVCSHGKVLTTNFDTYVLASSLDLPPAIATVPVTTNDPVGPWGAKGITEVAIRSVAPAILNAIHEAVGLRFRRLPVLPEDVLAALAERTSP
jgi:CO/xanthine dehydrogenase Mo-binding subunit